MEGILQFSTCQAGCLVSLASDTKITPLLEAATILKGQPISFPISLTGFSGALSRTAELLAD
ncbi:hypothetical protein NKH12_16650 [Mesorhizobium sp. M1322]